MSDEPLMASRQWESEADYYSRLLITSTSDIHFGVGIPGNRQLALIPRCTAVGTALDVGCGSGENALALSCLGYSVVGIDMSERQIALANKLKADSSDAPIFMTLSAERVSEVEGKFDIIISVGVMHFCANLRSVIGSIAEKLVNGGRFILSLPHPIDMVSDYKEIACDVEVTMGSYFPSGQSIRGSRYWSKFGGSDDSHYVFTEYVYTISDVISMFVGCGLTLEAFYEPVCDHKAEYPCRFRVATEHFLNFYSARVPQYAIFVGRKD